MLPPYFFLGPAVAPPLFHSRIATVCSHGRREGRDRGPASPWILKSSAKKVVLLVLSEKNQISPLLAPPGKI